jgi:peptidoglycan/LPS O-acetylase OafA/YrhL
MAAGPGYIPELDGMRALSILLVMLSHAGLGWIVPGGFGVTLFFGISGFIITRLLLAEQQARGRIDFGAFYLRRAVRLYPSLLAFVALASAALMAMGVPPGAGPLASALLYFANYWRVWTSFETGIDTFPHPFGILWSLAIEEHFYLLFPALLWLTLRRGFLPLILAASAASLAWRLALATGCAPGGSLSGSWACGREVADRIYLGTDTRLDAMLFGCLLAWLADRPPSPRATALLRHPAAAALAIALVLASLLYRDALFHETWRYTLQSLAVTLGLGPLLFAPALGRARAVLRWAPLQLLGRMSYVLYLMHWLAICLACLLTGQTLRETAYSPEWYMVALPLTAALSAAVYWGVEKPVGRWRHRMRARGAAGVVAA